MNTGGQQGRFERRCDVISGGWLLTASMPALAGKFGPISQGNLFPFFQVAALQCSEV